MERNFWLSLVVVPLFCACPSYADAPHKIAGFVLGANISQYDKLVRMDSAIPIRHMEYLTEVETTKILGYKNGYISYGTCAQPGRIVKIKLKYAIPDSWFFEELLKRFKKRLGEPSEWKGDPFRTLIAWKWSLKDAQKNNITVILQHYTGNDEEYTSGNSLRLTVRKFIEEERQCYEKKFPEAPGSDMQDGIYRPEDRNRIDYNPLIPE
ncbi:MAG TPA: hypothetical protein DCE18_06915 [Syntrophobacteraceae bacterium]|jgi:hypothetical protein|nr:hypothetical protein [Syntrophobacteraceae bacterium]HBZ54847.1 hypothetical protein [Syntrophobacteraceae bacterium]